MVILTVQLSRSFDTMKEAYSFKVIKTYVSQLDAKEWSVK